MNEKEKKQLRKKQLKAFKDFLKDPKNAKKVDRIIKKHSKKKYSELTAKQLFKKWKEDEKRKNKK